MLECLKCNNCITIERDHRDSKACNLMKPLCDYLLTPFEITVPFWCPKLKYFMIIHNGTTTKGQLHTKKDADLAISLIQNIKYEME